MLRFLLLVKYARIEHFQALFFSSYKMAAERAMKLFHGGLVDRTPLPARRGQPAMIHTLAAAGIHRLRAIGASIEREWRVKATSPIALEHELAVTDVLVSFLSGGGVVGATMKALERANKYLALTLPPPSLAGSIRPDAAALIDGANERLLALVEVDRGTMSAAQMTEKLSAYHDAALRKGCIEDMLAALLERHKLSFTDALASVKLLVTVPSHKRALQLAQLAVTVGLKRFVLLALHDEVVSGGVMGSVWKTAQAWVSDPDAPAMRLVD